MISNIIRTLKNCRSSTSVFSQSACVATVVTIHFFHGTCQCHSLASFPSPELQSYVYMALWCNGWNASCVHVHTLLLYICVFLSAALLSDRTSKHFIWHKNNFMLDQHEFTLPGVINRLYGSVLGKAHMQHMDEKWELLCSAVYPQSSFSSPGWITAFTSVWLAATRALWTSDSVKRMYISQPGLCAALPGNKAEKESHTEKTRWTDPAHPSPLHCIAEVYRESDSSYVSVLVYAYMKVDFVCIINKMCVCFFIMWSGIGLYNKKCTCLSFWVCVCKLG